MNSSLHNMEYKPVIIKKEQVPRLASLASEVHKAYVDRHNASALKTNSIQVHPVKIKEEQVSHFGTNDNGDSTASSPHADFATQWSETPVSTPPSPSTSLSSEGSTPPTCECDANGNLIRQAKKRRVANAHYERKRRMGIDESIAELKRLMPGCNSQHTKGDVLKITLEFVKKHL